MFRSIRARLILWYTGIVAVTFLLLSWAIYVYIDNALLDSLDQSLSSEAMWITTVLDKRYTRAESPDAIREEIFEHAAFYPVKEYIEVWDSTGHLFFHSLNLSDTDTLLTFVHPVSAKDLSIETVTEFRSHHVRLAGKKHNGMAVILGMPMEGVLKPLDQLLTIFFWLGPVVIIVAIAGGVYLARKSFSKINQVVETAQRITADRLHDRIPEHPAPDEIGKIVSTFNEMISRLDVSFSQMKQFSADASHELRTPLSVIRSQLETALNGNVDSDEARQIIANCFDETLRMSAIVESLLLLAKADAGQDGITRSPFNLKPVVQETYEESILLASQKSITVTLQKNEDVFIVGDAGRIRQMLLNLIDNAIKYNHEGGKIDLSLVCEKSTAKITVADTGIGIPEIEQGRIFDRFYRVDRARSRELGGAGLGLSIVKWIVQAHGGSIKVNSTINRGSEFIVSLPRQQ